jgi:hypothetical protein
LPHLWPTCSSSGWAPIDYSPILLLKPFGFRIAPDTLSSGICRATGSRSVLAVSGFRLRARLDFSIPSRSPGQRGITPAFGYSAPHPECRGDFNPHDSCAAQRTLRSSPPLCPASVFDPCGLSRLNPSLGIGTTGSHVPYKSLIQVRAAYMPDAVRAVSVHPPN